MTYQIRLANLPSSIYQKYFVWFIQQKNSMCDANFLKSIVFLHFYANVIKIKHIQNFQENYVFSRLKIGNFSEFWKSKIRNFVVTSASKCTAREVDTEKLTHEIKFGTAFHGEVFLCHSTLESDVMDEFLL